MPTLRKRKKISRGRTRTAHKRVRVKDRKREQHERESMYCYLEEGGGRRHIICAKRAENVRETSVIVNEVRARTVARKSKPYVLAHIAVKNN